MTLLIFLAVLSVLIFVHEFGHFIVAKKSGVKVEEFALGFPPRLFSRKHGETRYSINAIPIGGYVRLYGEDESVKGDQDRAYYHKGRLIRGAVAVAGVTMNFLLGVLAFSVIVAVNGIPEETGRVNVNDVVPGSPAQLAGFEKNDVVLAVGERVVAANTDEFKAAIADAQGKQVGVKITRAGQEILLSVTPRVDPPENEGPLGVVISSMALVKPPLWQLPFVSLWYGFLEAIGWIKNTAVGFSMVISQFAAGKMPEGVAGPVGIYQVTGIFAEQGVLPLIWFVGVLSINLAVLNAIPFPALDGGRLMFIAVEAIFGRRLVPRFEQVAHTVGLILLLALILFISFQDVTRLLNGGFEFPNQ